MLNLVYSLELKCDYQTNKSVSKCIALEWNVSSENENVTEFKGRQKNLKNQDVNYLRISYQNVKFLPNGIFAVFPMINSLDIFHSSLQNLEASNFVNAKELKKIDICRNNMSVLQHFVFAEAKNLSFLEMPQNKLSIISENAFSGLTKLWELSLKKNVVNNLPENVFKELTSLKMLDLSHNQIMEVNSMLFASNRDLEDLNLDFNHIEILDGELFKFNTKLSLILISHNHIITIGSQLLTYSDTFRKLNFYGNECINGCFGTSTCKFTIVDILIEEMRNKCNQNISHESATSVIDDPDDDFNLDEYDDLWFEDWDSDLMNEEDEVFKYEDDELDSTQYIVKEVDRWNNSWIISVLSVLAVSILVSIIYRKYYEHKIKSRQEDIIMSETLITEDS